MASFSPSSNGPMKRLFYALVAGLVRVTNWFMFSRIEVRGLDRVPWDQPCILSPNHQNAFLDALLVGVFAPVKLTFLSRASAFGSPFDWVLDALHMVPVYRRRNGFDKLSRNKRIFATLRDQLTQGRSLVMFSETEHAHTYHLRPLEPRQCPPRPHHPGGDRARGAARPRRHQLLPPPAPRLQGVNRHRRTARGVHVS